MLLNSGFGQDSWESLGLQEIQPVHPKGNQSCFIGRTDAEAETQILWPPDAKNWLLGKDPDAGKDWWHKEKGMTEDEILGWYNWLNWHEFEQIPGDSERQGNLVCYSPWPLRESDMNEWTITTRFVIAFLSRSNFLPPRSLLISCLHSLPTVSLQPKKIKSVSVSTFPLQFDTK